MTPLPKRRHSTRRGGKRQAAIILNTPALVTCANCGAKKLPHRVCRNCGYYDTKQVIAEKLKTATKAAV